MRLQSLRDPRQTSESNAALSALPLEWIFARWQISKNLAVGIWGKGVMFGPEICAVAQLLLLNFVLGALMYL
jgi:hypothetical protein